MIPKFRVWRKSIKKMAHVNAMFYGAKDDELTLSVNWWYVKDNGFVSSNDLIDDDVILMQSAGVRDKNGVEIFEGDIIRIDGGEYGDDIAVVDFVDGGFFADYHDLVTEFELLHSISLPIEVIGNIYENPELVEV